VRDWSGFGMDNQKALDFLIKMYPEGPWALTAIAPDKKFIETRTFGPSSEIALVEWLETHNGFRNLYFHTNEVRYAVTKKAERTDIKAVHYLHVDIDVQPGEDLTEGRARCLRVLTKDRPKEVPEPTVIVSSGGGVQAFWKLEEPIAINGEMGLAEDAKRYNQHLEVVFGADNCHNIDRIMRLPGTMNLPDAKKQKKGRVAELAKVLQFKKELVYPITQFVQAPVIHIHEQGNSFSGTTIYPEAKVAISGNVRRLESMDELDEWSVPERVKVIIMQGSHPEQRKDGDNSRSAWLHDVCCQLVRAGVPDDVIFSVITDPEHGISESVLEFKAKAEAYAIRQIERAKETAVDPVLREMNERYIVISNYGGKCRIVERVNDPMLGRSRITKQSFEDFKNAYMNKMVQVGVDDKGNPKYTPLGKWWLQHPQRKQSRQLIFAPNKVIDMEQGYNLWQGFAVQPLPGSCDVLLDHVQRNICNGNVEHYEYLLNWMARAIQQPACPGETAIVLRGAMGVGKSFLARVFGKLWGSHYMVVSNSSHLVGNFNAHLRDVCFLFADEAFFAGDKKHRSVLRSLITDELLPVESKGVDVEMAPNYLHIMMASNERHVIPAGEDERRYLILDVAKHNHQDSAFFGGLLKEMESGGYAALLHILLTRDISNFNVRNVPKTEALNEQKLLSMSPEEDWWYNKLQNGRILETHSKWEPCAIKKLVVDDFINTAKAWNVTRRGSETQLGKFMSHVIPGLTTKQLMAAMEVHIGNGQFVQETPRRYYHYVFPTLAECRVAWEDKFGKQHWAQPVDDDAQVSTPEIPF
jgi:Mesyanzhinovviridae DNA primase